MKRKIQTILLIAVMLFSLIPAVFAEPAGNVVLTIYYFYSDPRCPSCQKIETYTKKAVQEFFSENQSWGTLEFKMVDVGQKENEHFMKDYGLYTKSVVLSLVKDGRETASKNLDKIWTLLGNEDQFLAYVRDEVSQMVKGAS